MKNRYNPSLYTFLQIPDNSSIKLVKKSYRKLVFKYHPDTGSTPDSTKFIELTEVYSELSDPIKKEIYDLRLKTYKAIESEKERKQEERKSTRQKSRTYRQRDAYSDRRDSTIDMDDIIIGGAAIVLSAIVLNKVLKRSKR